ncbi:hypothetical protein [Burkholderia cepacia]|uniref:hypothetical protein n=1 Tax=Burkholderia cepacia TaxID=292 RepID=UPI000F5DF2C6|nr:hypothetical protein [Burkholderia cepacia]
MSIDGRLDISMWTSSISTCWHVFSLTLFGSCLRIIQTAESVALGMARRMIPIGDSTKRIRPKAWPFYM